MTKYDHQKIFKSFVGDCSGGTNLVFITKGAMETMQRDFNIKEMSQGIEFIQYDGLEDPTFIKIKPWVNNPEPQNEIMVYSWSFYSGPKYGYLAFFYQPKTSKWVIKSFKNNTNPDPKLQTEEVDDTELHNFAFAALGALNQDED